MRTASHSTEFDFAPYWRRAVARHLWGGSILVAFAIVLALGGVGCSASEPLTPRGSAGGAAGGAGALGDEAGYGAEGWTRFRGANGRGAIDRCSVPLPWTPEDVRWEIALPGKGNGSPITIGGKVFVMSASPDTAERYLLAFDAATGEELWRKTYASTPHHLHVKSSYASGTPCANASMVYFSWGAPESATLVALTHDGDEVWRRDFGSYVSDHGFGASPVLFGRTLVLFNSQQGNQLPRGREAGHSRVSALDCATGEILWETPREATNVCYGAPTRYRDASGTDAVLFCDTGDGIFALDLATGKPLWNSPVFVKRCVSSPVVVGGLAIGTEGSGGGGNILYGVDLNGDHEVKLKVNRSAPYVPTPVARGDLLFLWGDSGIVTCMPLSDGSTLWTKRIGGNVSTSPVIAGDKLIGIAEDGTVTILAAAEEFEKLGEIELNETTRATPALTEDFILVRTDSRLIRIGG